MAPESPVQSAPLVSVIVPHFNDVERLNLCLAALQRQSLPRDRFEIIVADNGSPQGAHAISEVIAGRAVLTEVFEKGAGAARNGGVALARGQIFAFTDSDCLPDPEWLGEGVKALQNYDLVGGRMHVLVRDPAHPTPAEAFELVFAFHNDAYVRGRGFSVSANLFCRRELFACVGPFATTGVSEDTEWCLRARAMGYQIGYAERASVGHPARRNDTELFGKWRRMNQENYLLTLRGKGGRLLWLARTLALPASALVHSPRALLSPRLPTLSARLGALGVLWRLRVWRTWDSFRLLMQA